MNWLFNVVLSIGSFKVWKRVCVSVNLQAFPTECAYCVWISLHMRVWACLLCLCSSCVSVCVCMCVLQWLVHSYESNFQLLHIFPPLQLMLLRLKSRVAYRLVPSLYFPEFAVFYGFFLCNMLSAISEWSSCTFISFNLWKMKYLCFLEHRVMRNLYAFSLV